MGWDSPGGLWRYRVPQGHIAVRSQLDSKRLAGAPPVDKWVLQEEEDAEGWVG